MPWVEPAEPHAKPPRVSRLGALDPWDGSLVDDRGAIDLVDVELNGPIQLELDGCRELSVRDSSLVGVVVPPRPALVFEVHRSVVDGCDLSGVTIATIRATRVVGSKLTGTDLTGASVADVVFERCHFRTASWRMARFRRVTFVDCTIDDVDAFEAVLEDVDVPGTSIVALNVDRLDATRVDLRRARTLELNGIGRLAGCLLAEHQLPALSVSLALAAGIEIERPD